MSWTILSLVIIGASFLEGFDSGMLAVTGLFVLWLIFSGLGGRDRC